MRGESGMPRGPTRRPRETNRRAPTSPALSLARRAHDIAGFRKHTKQKKRRAVHEAVAESEKMPLEADPTELQRVAENMAALSGGRCSNVHIPDDKEQTPRPPYEFIYLP